MTGSSRDFCGPELVIGIPSCLIIPEIETLGKPSRNDLTPKQTINMVQAKRELRMTSLLNVNRNE